MITVQKSRCVPVRNRHAGCDKCREACPAEAMALTSRGPQVDADACVGCGACVAACPTEALSLDGYQLDRAILDAAARADEGDGSVSVVCARAIDCSAMGEPHSVEVPCLALVDEAFLVGAAARGARRVALACADCSQCPSRVGRAMAEAAIARADALLRSVGSGLEVELTETLAEKPSAGSPAAAEAVEGQRSSAAKEAATIISLSNRGDSAPIAGAIPEPCPSARHLHARKGGMLPRLRSFRRDALLGGLWDQARSTEGAASVPRFESEKLWPAFSIDMSRCNGCQACVKMCPTGALEPICDDEGSVVGIEFFSGDCVQCGLCESVCPRGAVSLKEATPVTQVLAGVTERFEIGDFAYDLGTPDSMMEAMRLRLNCEVSAR